MVTGAAPSAASHLSKPRVPLSAVIGGGSDWGRQPPGVQVGALPRETFALAARRPAPALGPHVTGTPGPRPRVFPSLRAAQL